MERVMKLQQARARAKESGFTLVELAIVLVIIGLIIGGVLVGQDLIKAAEIRAQVSQIDAYNAAVNTFRGKYNGIPGDIRNVDKFFDTAATAWPDIRNGDGDRKLEACDTSTSGFCGTIASPGTSIAIADQATATHTGELLQFWHHLSAAQLIPGFYNGCDGATGAAADGCGVLDQAFPRTKLDRNGIGVFADGGRNYYQLGVIDGGNYEVEPSLTPEEAFNLDSKVDDGKPGVGSVVFRSAQPGGTAANTDPVVADGGFSGGTPTTACVTGVVGTDADSTLEYATLNQEISCSLRFTMN